MKTGTQAMIRFGDSVAKILRSRPATVVSFRNCPLERIRPGKGVHPALSFGGCFRISLHSYVTHGGTAKVRAIQSGSRKKH